MSDLAELTRNGSQGDERLDLRNPLRLKLRLKPLITSENEALGEELWRRRHDFDPMVSCTFCNELMQLEEIDFEWPYGRYSVIFPGIPAYRCASCERTFFPEEVRASLAAQVEHTVDQQLPSPIKRNPRATAFARRHSVSD